MGVAAVSLAGIYAPVTEQGNIIVENILASCYADFENHKLVHLAFAPLRWFHLGRKWFDSITSLENDVDVVLIEHYFLNFLNFLTKNWM